MRLDVIIPTYSRHKMLERTLESLLTAEAPSGLDVQVTVVDNNSKDATRLTVESYMSRFRGRLHYSFEGRQGRSFALNNGIASTSGDLVGMIDDDEEIDRNWYVRVHAAFSQDAIDFIGGPYVPRWGAEPPAWLPMNYLGVIGWINGGNEVRAYDENYPGILMGGNCVLKRLILERVGPYLTSLGRNDKHLLAGEDEDMYHRLLAIGARGLYIPDLIIYHYIPPDRLTKKYFRRWCFWRGVSIGLLDRKRRLPVTYLAGIPRYLYGQAARGLFRMAKVTVSKNKKPAQSFADELAVWDLIGFFYGKHFYMRSR